MKKYFKKYISYLVSLATLSGTIAVAPITAYAASFSTVGGWYETLYAEWSDSNPDSSAVSVGYKLSSASSYTYLSGNDLTYLVRKDSSSLGRVDIPGLKAGTYDLRVTSSSGTVYEKTGISVYAHDRSGYAHFNNTTGVGAYNDDGTPKSNAVILYVTNDNKNSVELPGYEGFKASTANTNVAKGVGNILNNNLELLKKVTMTDNRPLIVRIVDEVTAPDNLTPYDTKDSVLGGSSGDNGYLAIMKHGRNITIEGIGDNATVNGWGVTFAYTAAHPAGSGKNFEVRNITFKNYPEDGVAFQGESDTALIERCWIHNCNFYPGYCANPTESDKSDGDGSCDFKRGQYYTNSYNYYDSCHKTNLIGSGDSDNQWYITFHHNWYKNVESRQPLQAGGNVHIYNTYFQNAGSTTVDSRGYNSCFLEANYYDTCKNYIKLRKSTCVAKSYGESINGGSKGSIAGTYTVASSRTQSALKDNGLSFPDGSSMKDWDMNSSHFYYSGSKSNVQVLNSASEVPTYVKAHAGTLKSISNPGTTPGEGGDDIEVTTSANVTEATTEVTTQKTDETTETTTQAYVDPSGSASMGTYNIGTSASGGTFNITTKSASAGNIEFDFRSISTGDASLRGEDGYSITFNLSSSAQITCVVSSRAMKLTEGYSGTVYDLPIGTTTYEIGAGTYTIEGTDTANNSKISQIILQSTGSSEPSTEATTQAPVSTELTALDAGTYDAATILGDTSKFVVSNSTSDTQVKIASSDTVKFKVNSGATVTVNFKCGSSTETNSSYLTLNGQNSTTLAGGAAATDFTVSGLSAGTYTIGTSSSTTAQIITITVSYGGSVVTTTTTEATTEATTQTEASTEATTAFAPVKTINDGWYYIKNVNSNKYIDIEGGVASAGANVCQNSGSGANTQKWYVTYCSDGYYTFKNGAGEFNLDVYEWGTTDGTNIAIWDANNLDCQKFSINEVSSGQYSVLTKLTENVRGLDVYDISTADGANICQWEYWGGAGQLWIFESTSAPSTAVEIKGDVDEDGALELEDVMAVLSFVNGASASINSTKADVSGDNNVSAYDAYLMLRAFLNYITL